MCWFTESTKDSGRQLSNDYKVFRVIEQKSKFKIKSLFQDLNDSGIEVSLNFVIDVVETLQKKGRVYENFGEYIVK